MSSPEIKSSGSMWSKLGSPPDSDELEVTIFGAGFGESIVVHIGGGFWFVVDSCMDMFDSQTSRTPAPLRYLRAMEVNVETNVSAIVATHWDSDHVGGIGEIMEACTNAKFCCANALLQREFAQYRRRLLTGSAATGGAQVNDFSKVIDICDKRGSTIKWAAVGRELVVWPEQSLPFGKKCTLRSLSPSDEEFNLFLREVLGDMPDGRQSKRSAASQTPNLASVALHIDWEGTSVLLGADMEIHADNRRGWSSVIKDAQERCLSKAEVYKVAHHGSQNGHDARIWSELLIPLPAGMLTPYLRGRVESCPPTDEDINRITSLTSKSFITTRRNKDDDSNRPLVVRAGLRESGIVMKNKHRPMGAVRLRKRLGKESAWREELFGHACELSEHAKSTD